MSPRARHVRSSCRPGPGAGGPLRVLGSAAKARCGSLGAGARQQDPGTRPAPAAAAVPSRHTPAEEVKFGSRAGLPYLSRLVNATRWGFAPTP